MVHMLNDAIPFYCNKYSTVILPQLLVLCHSENFSITVKIFNIPQLELEGKGHYLKFKHVFGG